MNRNYPVVCKYVFMTKKLSLGPEYFLLAFLEKANANQNGIYVSKFRHALKSVLWWAMIADMLCQRTQWLYRHAMLGAHSNNNTGLLLFVPIAHIR